MYDKKSFDVFMCVRNNGGDLEKTLRCFKICEDNGYEFTYYIFENDSIDDTKEIVKDFLANRTGRFCSCNFKTTMWEHVVDRLRVKDMAFYRNMCKGMRQTTPSEYTLVVDTNISFSNDTLDQLLYPLLNDSSVVATFPYTQTAHGEYYDTYALRTIDDHKRLSFSTGSYIYVNSAFGGMCVLKSCHYSLVSYGIPDSLHDNEHVFLNNQLKELGELIICKKAISEWEA